MLTTDGKPVTRLETDAGIMLTKGKAFAMYHPSSGDVRVSSKYVVELVPAGRKSDGPGIGSAMRSLGWSSVQDRRTASKVRGWILTIDDPSL
jgi:hypothetical protein